MFGNNHYVGKLLKTSLPSLPADFIRRRSWPIQSDRAHVLIFNVSYKCDSKCVMCNSWEASVPRRLDDGGISKSVLERALPLDRICGHHRRRADAPEEHGRHRPHHGGQHAQAPENDPQHERLREGPGRLDARSHHRRCQRAGLHVRNPGQPRRGRRRARRHPSRVARLRARHGNGPRDAGAAEEEILQLRRLVHVYRPEPRRGQPYLRALQEKRT